MDPEREEQSASQMGVVQLPASSFQLSAFSSQLSAASAISFGFQLSAVVFRH
jgi:hypothetical protein